MKGFDCNTKLSHNTAVKFRRSGFEFAIRYVGRFTMNTRIDIDKKEIENILTAGLDLGLVQHCPAKPGIFPSKELGTTYGSNAALFAKQEGYEEGKILYLDLEDINPAYKYRQQDIYDFCNYWYENVYKDFTPGIYIGFNNYMTSEQLYSKLRFKDYWESLSRVPTVAVRGYAMTQYPYGTLHGIPIDKNIVTGDRLGRKPCFMQGKHIEPSAFDKALNTIYEAGITASPEYWRKQDLKHLDQLIINMANYIERSKT